MPKKRASVAKRAVEKKGAAKKSAAKKVAPKRGPAAIPSKVDKPAPEAVPASPVDNPANIANVAEPKDPPGQPPRAEPQLRSEAPVLRPGNPRDAA